MKITKSSLRGIIKEELSMSEAFPSLPTGDEPALREPTPDDPSQEAGPYLKGALANGLNDLGYDGDKIVATLVRWNQKDPFPRNQIGSYLRNFFKVKGQHTQKLGLQEASSPELTRENKTKITKSQLRQIIKEELDREIEEGFFKSLGKAGRQATSYMKGRRGMAKSIDGTPTGPQQAVARGHRMKLKKRLPVLVQKLQKLIDATESQKPHSEHGLPHLPHMLQRLQKVASNLEINEESMLDRAKEIGSNIKGAMRDRKARADDYQITKGTWRVKPTKAIYELRKEINSIKKIAENEPDIKAELEKLESAVIDWQLAYSKSGQKTYGN
jgi:hypothetical protein